MVLPTVILPGYFASALEYQALEQALRSRGIPTITVPLQKRDWIPTLGGRSVAPIVVKIDQTVKQALQEFQASQVNLIGHSAGGWIARIYLGDKPYWWRGNTPDQTCCWSARSSVSTLITLGTPHLSQERWTKRNLEFVNTTYPGAFFPEVRYVCVAGKAVQGIQRWRWGVPWTDVLAYSSYELTCGEGGCWGDGITPIAAAHLEGAENITIEGVRHSPRANGIWYGSPEPLEAWVSYLA